MTCESHEIQIAVSINKVLMEHRPLFTCTTIAESSSCERNHMACRAENIYYLDLSRKVLPKKSQFQRRQERFPHYWMDSSLSLSLAGCWGLGRRSWKVTQLQSINDTHPFTSVWAPAWTFFPVHTCLGVSGPWLISAGVVCRVWLACGVIFTCWGRRKLHRTTWGPRTCNYLWQSSQQSHWTTSSMSHCDCTWIILLGCMWGSTCPRTFTTASSVSFMEDAAVSTALVGGWAVSTQWGHLQL